MSNNCFNWNPRPLDKPIRAIAKAADLYIMRTNNTPQAYLPVHRHDAQTGGLLIPGVESTHVLRILTPNTPAMPLYDAHFGGFFASGYY